MEQRPTNRADLRPRTTIVVTARSATGELLVNELIQVTRPPGPSRQRDQLARAVLDRFPDARLQRAADGVAVFICRDTVMTAAYAEPARSVHAA